jgi:hypothetical protein
MLSRSFFQGDSTPWTVDHTIISHHPVEQAMDTVLQRRMRWLSPLKTLPRRLYGRK